MYGDQKSQVVFVLGGPGAGKGTQCKKIVSKFGFVHLSAGDLLRAEAGMPGSKHGEMIESCIKEGKIVPVDVTCDLIKTAMEESSVKRFLIDGFPRNEDNLNGWNKAMGIHATLLFVLFFDCMRKTCISRCLKRGEAGSRRADDNSESIRLRFDTYMNDTLPIIEHYEALNMVKRIDSNRWFNKVFRDVTQIFEVL